MTQAETFSTPLRILSLGPRVENILPGGWLISFEQSLKILSSSNVVISREIPGKVPRDYYCRGLIERAISGRGKNSEGQRTRGVVPIEYSFGVGRMVKKGLDVCKKVDALPSRRGVDDP